MNLRVRITLLALLSPCALAFEATDTAGLRLQVESLAQSVEVDGARFLISRASGQSVPELTERVRRRWRETGNPVQELTSGDWQIVSRWHGQASEVLQWRQRGTLGEAILSVFHPGAPSFRSRRVPFNLPANCAWGRIIAGGAGYSAFQQASAFCRGTPERDRNLILVAVREAGWRFAENGEPAMRLTRGASEAVLTLTRTARQPGFALVWLTTRPSQDATR